MAKTKPRACGPAVEFDREYVSRSLDPATPATIHVVAQSHLDLAWHWTQDDAVEMIRHTFEGHIELLGNNRDLTFNHSQLWSYALLEDLYPDLFKRLKCLVKRGQWEIVGGGWVEPGVSNVSGESMARQYLFGQRYAREKLGVSARVAWAPDDAGHTNNLPQIYAHAGLDCVYLKRPREKFLHMPITPFWWKGIDGTRMLSFRTVDLVDGLPHLSEGTETPEGMTPLAYLRQQFAEKNLKDFWGSLGVGDHGGVNQMPDPIRDDNWEIRYSHPSVFFDRVREDARDLPELDGEFHGSFRATYTTHLPIKEGNRKGETGLLAAETLSALAWLERLADYPADRFRQTWDRLLFNQFHDIIWGAGRANVHFDARRDFAQIRRNAFELQRRAMIRIGEQVDTQGPGSPVVVFNTLAHERDGLVEVDLDGNGFRGQWVVSDGVKEVSRATVLERRAEQRFDCHKVCFIAEKVPAMGYKVFYLTSEEARTLRRHSHRNTARSPWYEVEADPVTGFVRSLVDRKTGRQFVAPGEFFAEWQIWEEGLDVLDYDNRHRAWNISTTGRIDRPERTAMPDLVEESPLRTTLRIDHIYGESTFRQDIHLYQTRPLIEVEVTVDYQEMMKLARLQFASNVGPVTSWTGNIHFGSVSRPADGQEFPTHGWADISGPDTGVAVVNNGRYGISADRHRLRISVVRCSDYPDPVSDRGVSRFVYRIIPHEGDWRSAGVPRWSSELEQPLAAREFRPHMGRLPKEHSWLRIDGAQFVPTCLKRAEDGRALILRFHEATGRDSDCRVDFCGREHEVAETNFMEDPFTAPKQVSSWQSSLGPYEIKSLKLGC